MKTTEKCAHCGAVFKVLRPWQTYCSQECYKRAAQKRRRQQREAQRAAEGLLTEADKPLLTLAEAAIAARKAGMSYGQFVAGQQK